MPGNSRNIYKAAREAAGYTQERAAEMLGISETSIRAYETGHRLPPAEVVDLMVTVYDSQYLAVQFLRESADLAKSVLPEVEQVRLPEAVMELVDAIYQFADAHRDRQLISIAKDGVIDENERPEFDSIAAELQEIVKAAMAVRYAKQG